MTDNKFDAAMFDLDGTLLDTVEDLAAAMNSALESCSLPRQDDIDKHFYFVGDGVLNYILRAMPEDRREDKELVSRIKDIYNANYSAGWHNKSRPYNGVTDMLEKLAATGMKISVLSNKPENFTVEMVSHFLGGFDFDIVRGARENFPLKPDPAAALEMASKLDTDPSRIIYVGDTATDMKTAVSAGFFAVGCLWGFRKEDELRSAGANEIISHPSELLSLI